MTDPKILLLDEPVAGMITTELEDMANLVAQIRKDFGVTILSFLKSSYTSNKYVYIDVSILKLEIFGILFTC